MVLTTTSIAFILLSIGLLVCGWWFLQAFRNTDRFKADRRIGFLLSSFFLGFGFTDGIFGLGAFFFATNSMGLYITLIVYNIFLALLGMLGAYTAYYVFFPKRSPYALMFLIGLIGVAATAVTILTYPQSFITTGNSIDTNMSRSLSLLMFLLLFFSIGAPFYIFSRLFFDAKTFKTKLLSLTISILALAGILNVFIDLVLLRDAPINFRTQFQNIIIGGIGAGFIIALVIIPFAKRLFTLQRKKV